MNLDNFIGNPGLSHLAKKIIRNLDLRSLMFCRAVSKTWEIFIDHEFEDLQKLLLGLTSILYEKRYFVDSRQYATITKFYPWVKEAIGYFLLEAKIEKVRLFVGQSMFF